MASYRFLRCSRVLILAITAMSFVACASGKVWAQEQPAQNAPVQQQPVQTQPVQEQPVQEQPVQEQPVQEQPKDQYDEQAVVLLDKYVAATGGAAAYDAIKNRIMKAELSQPARGVTGKMTAYSARPDKFYVVIETARGKMERGWNGKTAWMIEPAFGPRILTGSERAAVVRDSTQDRFAHWRELFSQAKYDGEEEINGRKYAKVVLTYRPLESLAVESPVTVYLDTATGLIGQYITEVIGPHSFVKVTAILDDYQKASGVLLARKMTLKTEGGEQEIKVTSVECNTQCPDSIFVLPREIQELLVK